jgi:RNA polymerase sigma-70 factor (ECF subfamily)
VTDEAEFRQFVAHRSTSLLRTAYLLVGDWAHAEDVLQTALTKTYLAWRRLGEIEAIEAYARRVLVTTATSWWRRRWHGERPSQMLPERAEDPYDGWAERQTIWATVQTLPDRQRAVLVLRFYEDLTEAQTAQVLGISVGTVKSQTARALATLRERLVAAGAGGLFPTVGPTEGPVMNQIEDLLRDTFRGLADTAPATEGIADRAIRRGRQVRRSRTVGGSLLAVVCVAFASVGIVVLVGGPRSVVPPGGAGQTGPAMALPVDVADGDQVLLAGGGSRRLAGVTTTCELCWLRGAWRVPDGWLINVHHLLPALGVEESALWLIPESPTDPANALLAGEGLLLVSPGTAHFPGVHVVWIADGRLRLGRYADATVTEVASTQAPIHDLAGELEGRPLYPQALVGEAVVLAGTRTGGGLDIWDVWFPGRGDYVPAEHPIITAQAVTHDRERLVALYSPDGGKDRCLGELDPDGFTPARSVCPSPVGDWGPVLPSPDGRWWVVKRPTGIDLYDAETVWHGAAPVRSLPQSDGLSGVAWIDAESFVVVRRSDATIVHTDGRPSEVWPLYLEDDVTQASMVVDLR